MAANFDREESIRGLAVYHQRGDTFEIRIPDAGRAKTISGYFIDFAKAADEIQGGGAFAIYVTINPVNPKLIGRANNRLKTYAKNTTSDADIVRLNWLPVDGDPPRPAGISATDEEHDISVSRIRDIRQWLIEDQGWPAGAFVIVDSGNGGYLLARIELENTKDNSGLVKKCLEALDCLYSDETFHVDTTSANPARILRVPGTMNAKGDEVGDMKHRMAQILETPDSYEVVPRVLLEALAAMLPEPEGVSRPTHNTGGAAFDPVAYCQAHNLQVHHTKPWTDRAGAKCTAAVLEQCVFNPDHHLSAVIIGWPNGMRSYRCRHNSCLGLHWADAKEIIEPDGTTKKEKRENAGNPPWLRADADKFEAEHPGCKIFNCDDDPKQGEISEEEASKYVIPSNPKQILNLEKDNFLSQYVAYGNELSDAYPDYFFMNGLEMLAIINDRKTYVHLGVKKIYPNVYINQLGASTIAHKSTAMDDNEACMEELNGGRYHPAPSDGSPEGWLEGMAEDGSHAYCNQDEVANYLARMHKHDYMAGMTDILNKVFDGATITKRNSRKKGNQPNKWTIKDPYYNQLYATTAEKFSFVTTSMDVHSGFWVRFLHSYPNYDREKFPPLREASAELLALQQQVIDRLRRIQTEISTLVDARVKIESDGWKYYETWQIQWNRRLRKTSDDFIRQILGRYNVYVLKLGMLFTMGRGDFDHKNIIISTDHIKEACRLIDEYFVPHALAVRDLIGEGAAKDTNLIVKIESVLRVNGGQITHRLLLKKTKVSTSQLNDALDTMVTSGTIAIKIVKNPHGRATEKIFLLKDDESIMSIMSPDQGQYENRDGDIKSKKVKGDIIKGKDIVKPHTATQIREDSVDNVHIVPDKLSSVVGEPPLSKKGDIMGTDSEQSISGEPKRGQYKTGEQQLKKSGDNRDIMAEPVKVGKIERPTPPKTPPRDDTGFKKFQAGMKKRHCLLCGQNFSYDLGVHFQGGYICARCHREGPPPAPVKPDSQTTLGKDEAKA